MDIEFEHKIEHMQPISVEVERGMRGGYGWKIKVYGENTAVIMTQVQGADQQLRALFLVKGEAVKDESKEHTD